MKLRFATLLETLTSVAFVPPIPKPMQLSAGRFNLLVGNIAPFLSRLLSCRNRIAAPNWLTVVTAQDMLKTSARLFEFHRCTVYTVPPSCSPIGPYCSCFLFLLLHLLWTPEVIPIPSYFLPAVTLLVAMVLTTFLFHIHSAIADRHQVSPILAMPIRTHSEEITAHHEDYLGKS